MPASAVPSSAGAGPGGGADAAAAAAAADGLLPTVAFAFGVACVVDGAGGFREFGNRREGTKQLR